MTKKYTLSAINLRDKLNSNFIGRIILHILSVFYRVAVFLHRLAYEIGIRKKLSVKPWVICFGNITTGGTGKTTAVMFAAKIFADHGLKTAIVSRGYKRQNKRKEVVIIDNENQLPQTQSGDEPYLLFHSLKEHNIPVVVCADRYRAARTVSRKFNSSIILLDDGFQHHRLKKDVNVIVVDAKDPFGGGYLLPKGLLREPKSALKRADIILLTHVDLVKKEYVEEIEEEIKSINPKAKIILTVHEPQYYLDVFKNKKIPVSEIKGAAAVLSAVGNPQSFEETLIQLGISAEKVWRYPDHYPFTDEDLVSVENLRNNLPLITTYKDFIRFPASWREILKENVYILSVSLQMTEEDTAVFKKILYPQL